VQAHDVSPNARLAVRSGVTREANRNLVLSDTIEGRIFPLLEDKLTEIAKAVGKVDAQGEGAEDMRAQTLACWSITERLQILTSTAERALQRELRQRAMAGESGG